MASSSKPRLVIGVAKGKWPSFAQLRYINNLLTQRERWTVFACSLLLVLSLGYLALSLYWSLTTVVPAYGGEYREALVGHPQYVNPILSQSNDVDSDLTHLIFSGMFHRTKDQQLDKELVTDYTISEDQLTYTFYIRRDAKWHDGEPLTAADILFTINSIQDPNWQSPLEPSLRGVTAAQVDDYTLTLTLEEPFAPFLSSLTFGILPQHIWYDAYKISPQNITLSEYNIRPIGSGPFMFDSLVKEAGGILKSYQVVSFKDYYGHKPYIQT